MSDPSFRPDPDAQWDALLRQLRQQAAAPPDPLLYGRVRSRLLAQASAPLLGLPAWLRRPAYALVVGALMLAVSGDGAAATLGGPAAAAAPRAVP